MFLFIRLKYWNQFCFFFYSCNLLWNCPAWIFLYLKIFCLSAGGESVMQGFFFFFSFPKTWFPMMKAYKRRLYQSPQSGRNQKQRWPLRPSCGESWWPQWSQSVLQIVHNKVCVEYKVPNSVRRLLLLLLLLTVQETSLVGTLSSKRWCHL